jgi:hypothetical protein
MQERILTLHPDPSKQGVNIDRIKYHVIREAILETIRDRDGITFSELTQAVRDRIEDHFDGSVSWYVTTVKLDLEARALIVRAPGSGPQRLHLAPGSA